MRELTLSAEDQREKMLEEKLRRDRERCKQDERAIEEHQIKVCTLNWILCPRGAGCVYWPGGGRIVALVCMHAMPTFFLELSLSLISDSA